jgi:hypothetical protein
VTLRAATNKFLNMITMKAANLVFFLAIDYGLEMSVPTSVVYRVKGLFVLQLSHPFSKLFVTPALPFWMSIKFLVTQ